MKFLPGNAQHIGSLPEQQDAFAFSDPADEEFLSHAGLLALVSDGMGGLSQGHQASSAAVRAFLNAYEQKPREETIPAAMWRSFEAAFAVVQALNRSALEPSGATLVAATVHADYLYWISIGDSRLYLIRAGRLVQLSRDHNYQEKLFDQVGLESMSRNDVLSEQDREQLTSYLGMAGTPELDRNVKPFQLAPDDEVILCTDGIYRSVQDQDFVTAFSEGNTSVGCDRLKALVLAQGREQQDNLTVVAIRCADLKTIPAASGWSLRAKLVAGAAGLMVCANLLAADFAWKSLSSQVDRLETAADREQKKQEPRSSIDSSPNAKPSSAGPAADVGKLPPADGARGGEPAMAQPGDGDSGEAKLPGEHHSKHDAPANDAQPASVPVNNQPSQKPVEKSSSKGKSSKKGTKKVRQSSSPEKH